MLCFILKHLLTETHTGIKLFTGNANKPLAQDIANHLGMNLGKINVSHFADGEVNVMVNENVRGKDVYIVQPTSPPVNETLMELLLMISTMRRASARKITAIIPYYGYARQDRKMQARVPISAADVARLLEAMGVDRVVAVDLHCGQIQVDVGVVVCGAMCVCAACSLHVFDIVRGRSSCNGLFLHRILSRTHITEGVLWPSCARRQPRWWYRRRLLLW